MRRLLSLTLRVPPVFSSTLELAKGPELESTDGQIASSFSHSAFQNEFDSPLSPPNPLRRMIEQFQNY